MPRTLPVGAIAALSAGDIDAAVFIKIATPTATLRMTSEPSPVVFEGETYLPALFGQISDVKEADTLEQTGVSFSVTGLEQDIGALVVRPDFINSPMQIWARFSNETDSGNMLVFEGFTTGAPAVDFGGDFSILISCQGKFVALNRPRTIRYADAEQRRKHPSDKGMEYAAQISSREVVWPAATWFKNNS